MFSIPKITTAKDIQKNYRRVFDYVKKTQRPVVVMRNNKPDVAIVDVKKLEEMEAVIDVLQSREEVRQGKAKPLKSLKDLWYEAQNS
jgi:prevent-host-death family protein